MKHLILAIGLLTTTVACAKNKSTDESVPDQGASLSPPADESANQSEIPAPGPSPSPDVQVPPSAEDPVPLPTDSQPAAVAPEVLEVVSLSSLGSGCEKDSATVVVSEDKLSLIVDLGSLESSVTENGPIGDRRKACNLSLKLAHSEGYEASIVGVATTLSGKVAKDLVGKFAVKARVQAEEQESIAEHELNNTKKKVTVDVDQALDQPLVLADLAKSLLLTVTSTLASKDGTIDSRGRSFLALEGPVVLKLQFTKKETNDGDVIIHP